MNITFQALWGALSTTTLVKKASLKRYLHSTCQGENIIMNNYCMFSLDEIALHFLPIIIEIVYVNLYELRYAVHSSS